MAVNHDYDVAIIGGGPAGLSAALLLGRSVREVVIFDRGPTRNAPARSANGVFTRDGMPVSELLTVARKQLSPYDIAVQKKEITDIKKDNDGFEILSSSGPEATSRKVILCTGVVDQLPDIPGLKELWGKSVVHCPYCHGWEVRGKPIAALVNSHTIKPFASLLNGWSDDLFLLTNGPIDIYDDVQEKLQAHGIQVIEDHIEKLRGSDGGLEKIVFESGEELQRDALFINPGQRLRSKVIDNLELELNAEGRIHTNKFGETSIPGIYAAGDAGPNMQQVTVAASTGAEVAIAINHLLVEEDF